MRRAATRCVQTVLALLSIAIVVASGWGWVTYRHFVNGLHTSSALDVLGAHAKTSKHGDINILLIGLDSRRNMDGSALPRAELGPLHAGDSSDVGGYNTNTLILMHIPGDGSRATAVSIPRDDYVAVPGYGMQKIKEAYGLSKADADSRLYKQGVPEPRREELSRDAGRRSTIATVENLLHVPIDNFAEVNLIGFYDIVQAIGPVTVCLNHAVNDAKYSGAVFPAGVQSLDPSQALAFVRQRHGLPHGDLDRTHRQQAFISSVTHKLRADGVIGDLGKLQGLIDVTKKDVVIDNRLNPITFAGEATSLTSGNVDFYTLPVQGFATRNGQDVNLIDPAQLQTEVAALFSDHPPAKVKPAAAPRLIDAAHETVDVYNGSGQDGLAGQTSAHLVAQGFLRGVIGTLGVDRSATTVTFGAGAAQDAAVLAGGFHVRAQADAQVPAGHIVVDLGSGPVSTAAGSQTASVQSRGGTPCVD